MNISRIYLLYDVDLDLEIRELFFHDRKLIKLFFEYRASISSFEEALSHILENLNAHLLEE
jgi:hypothetical protein